HEHELLESLAAIRSGGSVDARVQREGSAVAATRAVLMLHERYPQLRSDALYRDLHDRLWAIEEKLAHARTCYNDAVTEWNDRLQQFPSNLVASAAGHQAAAVFAAEVDESLPPRLIDLTANRSSP
ncbi:MAG: LemA family protein, partial [Planctomycetota bacterium]